MKPEKLELTFKGRFKEESTSQPLRVYLLFQPAVLTSECASHYPDVFLRPRSGSCVLYPDVRMPTGAILKLRPRDLSLGQTDCMWVLKLEIVE